jgi:hypothetical protein
MNDLITDDEDEEPEDDDRRKWHDIDDICGLPMPPRDDDYYQLMGDAISGLIDDVYPPNEG